MKMETTDTLCFSEDGKEKKGPLVCRVILALLLDSWSRTTSQDERQWDAVLYACILTIRVHIATYLPTYLPNDT